MDDEVVRLDGAPRHAHRLSSSVRHRDGHHLRRRREADRLQFDRLSLHDPFAQRLRKLLVEFDPVSEQRQASLWSDGDRSKHSRAVQLVVVAMVEVPGQP